MKALLLGLLLVPIAPALQAAPDLRVDVAGLGYRSLVDLPNGRVEDPRSMQAKYYGRRDGWLPFEIVLSNRGGPVTGSLELTAQPPGAQGMVWRQPINLSSGARKRVTIPMFNGWVGPLNVSFKSDGGRSFPLNGETDFQVKQPNHAAPFTPLFLLFTERAGGYGHFLDKGGSGQHLTTRYLVPMAAADCPVDALSLESADVVVIDDLPVSAFTVAQQEALYQFVQRGGVLVLCLQDNATSYANSLFASMAPGRPLGLRNVSRIDALAGWDKPFELASPMAIQSFEPAPGAHAWGPDSAILQKRFGLGSVVAFGLRFSSPCFETWGGSTDVTAALGSLRRRPSLDAPGTVQESATRGVLAKILKESIAKALPPFRTMALLMGGYLAVILLLPYGVFRVARRLEWAWAGVLVIAVTGSATVYAIGSRYLEGSSSAIRVSVVEGAPGGDRPVMRNNFWCLFSASGGRLSLDFDGDPIPFPFGTELGLRGVRRAEPMVASRDAGAQILDLRTYPQDSRTFETVDAWKAPGSIEFSQLSDTEFEFRASPDFPLMGAWLVTARGCAPVKPGKLRAPMGEEVERFPGVLEGRTLLAIINEVRTRSDFSTTLVYQYNAPGSLDQPSNVAERAYHYGILVPETAPSNWDQVAWTVTRAPGNDHSPLLTIRSKGLDYGWLPREFHASVPYGAEYNVEFLEFATGEWHGAGFGYDPAYFHRLPGGDVAVKVRLVPTRPGQHVRYSDIAPVTVRVWDYRRSDK